MVFPVTVQPEANLMNYGRLYQAAEWVAQFSHAHFAVYVIFFAIDPRMLGICEVV